MQTHTIPMEQLGKLILTQLENGGRAMLTVTGSSMYPLFRHRVDRVALSVPKSCPEKGDIILYCRSNGDYILHRIVRVTAPGSYICCGDNQWEPENVEVSQVVATVAGFYRGEKFYLVSDLGCRLYTAFCTGLFPWRKQLLSFRRGLGKIRKALKI